MTVMELVLLVSGKVEAPVEDVFSAVNAVSAALMQLAATKGLSIATGSTFVNTVANQDDVLLPTTVRALTTNPRIETLELHKMPPGGESTYSTTAKPSFYRLEGRRMVLAPTPDAVYPIFLSYYAHAEKVSEVTDDLPFSGVLDEAFPGLVVLVMAKSRLILAAQESQALLSMAIMPLVLIEEQATADDMNNYA